MADAIEPNAIVTVESGGRTLSGAGVSAEQLQETVDSHAERHDKTAGDVDKAPASPVSTGSAAAPALEQGPPKTRGQARFSELTSARKAAEEKAEAAERRAAELEARLAQQPRAEPQRQEQSQQPPVAQSAQPTREKPSEDDIGTKYDTYAAFVEDLSDWKTEQRLAAQDMRAAVREMLKAEREAATFDAHVEATRAKGRAAYKDFDAQLANGPGTFVNMPLPAVHAILNHPASEHLQYQVMKDGALAQRLAQLAFTNPYAFAFELAKLAPAEQPSNGHRPPQNIPAPMQPVGSGSRSSVPTSAEAAEKGNYQEYKARRAAERRGQR